MQIKKYEHACFVATKNGQSIVIDPGSLSPDFVAPENIAAVVVTHLHADHWSADHLLAMPHAPIYAPEDAAAAIREAGVEATVVKQGDTVTAGEFTLTFTGGDHALIHPDTPMCKNVGVLIDNGELYYPGDSFALPGAPVKTLALPIAAPWMKTAEAMDFLTAVKPERAFPTHDAVLSDAGKQFVDGWISIAAEKAGVVYERQ
ncbi:MAG: MBL fold metallo-hydrolase [Candidatus Saccharimonas sp.]